MDEARGKRFLKLKKARRDTLIQSIERLHALTLGDAIDIPMFKARYECLEEKYSSFLTLCDEIREGLVEYNMEFGEEFSITNRVEELYYEIKAVANRMLPTEISNANTGPSNGSQAARLPKINIPTFDGELANFKSFHDVFRSLIHDSTQLTDIEKFHYLLSSVKGNARKIVTGLPLVSENYAIVWNTLVQQYENKRILAL